MTAPASETLASTPAQLSRFHRTRLMQIWRSAGWPCKDGLEIDLLAAGLISLHTAPDGCETLRLTDEGIRTLAQARQRGVRALSLHDRLGQKFAAQLLASGRIVWTELSLRAVIDTGASNVTMNMDFARRIGIDFNAARRVVSQTANGSVVAWQVPLRSVQVGEISVSNVAGQVIEGGQDKLPVVLIGMSFLKHVEMRRSGDTLSLSRPHLQ